MAKKSGIGTVETKDGKAYWNPGLVELQAPKTSGSGKTMTVAFKSGFLPVMINGKLAEVRISVFLPMDVAAVVPTKYIKL